MPSEMYMTTFDFVRWGACSESRSTVIAGMDASGRVFAKESSAPLAYKIWAIRCYHNRFPNITEELSLQIGCAALPEEIYNLYSKSDSNQRAVIESFYLALESKHG